MEIIDTHIHPELIIEFQNKNNNSFLNNDYIIEESKKKFLNKMFCICTELKDVFNLREIAKKYNEYYFSIGIHPCDVKDVDFNISMQELEQNIIEIKKNNEKIIGIGEVGIDFFREEDALCKNKQIDFFIGQIQLSIRHNLPLIIHTRNATQETYNILKQYQGKISGTVHAFQYDYDWAKKFIDLGFVLGIAGIITYPKNNHIREAVKSCGIEYIVLETDSPFLPIQSMRGKINYPHYCYDIGIYLSQYLEIEKELFFDQVYKNTVRIFKF